MRTSRTVIAILVIFLLSFGLKTGPAFSADQAFLGAVRELSGVVSPSGTFSAPPVAPIALAPGENFYLVFWAGPLSTNMTFSSAVVTIPPGFVTNGRGSGVSVPPGRTGAIPLTLTSSANASAGATWFAAIGVRAPLVQGSQTATAQSQNTAGSAFTATSPTLTVASPDIAVTLLPPQSTAQTIATLTSASLNVLTPRDGATNVLQPVQFTWQSVPDTVKYRILVSDKSDLSKLYAQWEVQGGATTSYYNPLNDPQTLALSSGTQYYWRVQALDGAGRLLASSSILKFQIEGTATSQTLKHDVAIDKITVPAPLESGAPGKIVVTISNKGTFPESNSSLQLFAKGQPAGTVPVPILNLNETKEITFPYTATSPGTLALSAILSQSADEDMRNNVSNATFTATTPQVNPSLDVNKKAFIKGESVVQKVTGCTPGGMLYGLVINPDGSQAKNGPYGPTDAGGSWSSAWDTGTAWWPNTQFGQYTIRYKDITTGKETNSAAFTVVASFGFNFPEAPATGAYNVKPGATMLAKVSGSTPGGTIQAYSGPTTGPQETALRGTANVVATGTADSSGNAAFTFTPTAPGYWVLWFVDTSTGKKSNIGNFTIFVHELILTPVSLVPDPPSINSQAIWTVRVTNGGGYTETWAPVQFSVDGTVLATQYVKSLAPGASQDVTFPWTPIVVRSYSFETAVVLGDDIEQGNNKDIRSISAAFAGPATQSAALGTEDTGAFGRAFHLYGGTPVLGNSCDRGGGTGSHQWGPGWTQDFCGGSAGDSALMQPADQSNILWVHGTMWQKYRSGGPDKYGYPRSNELPIPASPKGTSGVYQLFQKGIMVWHRNGPKAGQVFWTTYDVGQAWIAKGGAGGPLGFPITEEYSWNGTPTQNYEGGYITWTGQANVTIYKKPGELRVSKGIWIKEPPVEIGKYFDMQYWAKNYGDEPIRVKMLIMALRGPGGENIDPVQDLSARTVGPGEEVQVFVAIPNLGIPRKPGVYTAFASYQDFSGNWHELSAGEPGTLASRGFGVSLPAIAIAQAPAAPPPVTQPTPQSGQPAATGSEDTDAFAKAFQLYGGTPVLGVSKGPSHPWGEGWVQDFAGGSAGDSALMQPKDQGKILWVHGSIWNQYKIGGPTKHGYPRGNEEPAGTSPSGTTGVKQEFANGTLYWMQNGPHTGEVSRLYGGIRDTWAGTASKLGFPLGEEKPWRNGNRQDFEGGYIYWFAGKGNIAYQDIRDRSLYKAALIEKSPIPSLQPGQEATVWVKVRNTGEVAWYKGGQYPIVLGTAAPQDRKSPFTHDSWGGAGKDRPATMREDEVLPGEVATFEFKIKAPTEAKTHNEAFQPVAENLTWFGDQVAWEMRVESESRPSSGTQGPDPGSQTSAQGETGFRQNECTSYAAGKRPDFFVAVLKNAPRPRHAKYWAQFASASGWKVDTSPLDGAIVVWETGSSKLLQEYGHVAVVETYDRTSDTITVGEKNWDGKGTESHGRKIQNASSIGLKYIGPRSETAHPPASNSQPGATPSAAPSSPPATATSEPARSTSSSTPILFLTRDERMQEPAEKVVKAAGLTDVYIFSYPRDIDNYKQLAKEKNTPDDYVKKYLSGASGRGVSDKSYTRSIMIKPGASSPDAIAFTIGHELAHLIEKKLEVTVEDMQRFFPADYKRWKASMDKNYQERALKIEDRIIAYMERDKEAQADLQGLKWAEQAGYSVDEMLRVFGGTSSKVLSLLHEFSDIILKYLFVTDTPDSHYADSERLKRLERWVDGLGGGGSW